MTKLRFTMSSNLMFQTELMYEFISKLSDES